MILEQIQNRRLRREREAQLAQMQIPPLAITPNFITQLLERIQGSNNNNEGSTGNNRNGPRSLNNNGRYLEQQVYRDSNGLSQNHVTFDHSLNQQIELTQKRLSLIRSGVIYLCLVHKNNQFALMLNLFKLVVLNPFQVAWISYGNFVFFSFHVQTQCGERDLSDYNRLNTFVLIVLIIGYIQLLYFAVVIAYLVYLIVIKTRISPSQIAQDNPGSQQRMNNQDDENNMNSDQEFDEEVQNNLFGIRNRAQLTLFKHNLDKYIKQLKKRKYKQVSRKGNSLKQSKSLNNSEKVEVLDECLICLNKFQTGLGSSPENNSQQNDESINDTLEQNQQLSNVHQQSMLLQEISRSSIQANPQTIVRMISLVEIPGPPGQLNNTNLYILEENFGLAIDHSINHETPTALQSSQRRMLNLYQRSLIMQEIDQIIEEEITLQQQTLNNTDIQNYRGGISRSNSQIIIESFDVEEQNQDDIGS
eukprot:403360296